jgi:hypothetical protein
MNSWVMTTSMRKDKNGGDEMALEMLSLGSLAPRHDPRHGATFDYHTMSSSSPIIVDTTCWAAPDSWS